jgi:hypothetical protein
VNLITRHLPAPSSRMNRVVHLSPICACFVLSGVSKCEHLKQMFIFGLIQKSHVQYRVKSKLDVPALVFVWSGGTESLPKFLGGKVLCHEAMFT